MQNPGILLADEPVASLDPKNTQRIMDVLREISEQGISVMVNLHSVELVRAYCTRVIGVASGQLIFDDHPSRLTQDVLQRLQRLLDDGYLTRFGPLFQIERAGGQFVLAALSAPEAQFDAVTAQVNALPEVAHNYRREHALNMWFVVAAESPAQATEVLQRIEGATGLKVHAFPKEREYRVELRLPLLPPGETLPPPLEVPHGAGCV